MDIVELQKKVTPQIRELLKKEPETISSVEETKEGWVVQSEVLERKAVPETFDLLRVFEFKLDGQAKVRGFKEIGRRRRGDLKEEM